MAVSIVKHVFQTLASYINFTGTFGENDIVEIKDLPDIVDTNAFTIAEHTATIAEHTATIATNTKAIADLGTATGGGYLSSSGTGEEITYKNPAQLTKMAVQEQGFVPSNTKDNTNNSYENGTIIWIKE